jgi:DNA-binding PadR family transcriptional regulator
LAETKSQLTDDEGAFLALVIRVEPATAYQLSKIYAESPVSNFGTSKGKIYPLIRRMKARKLLASEAVAEDRRGSELLRSTAAGRKAVRRWVMEIRPTHLLPEDPLRTKLQSFDLLAPEEQREWVAQARAALAEKLDEVEQYGKGVTVPYKDLVHDNAVISIRSRLDWLERVGRRIRRRSAA